MKPILITFETPEAASRFIDAILGIEDGKGITIHLASKEIEEFTEKYLKNKNSEKKED